MMLVFSLIIYVLKFVFLDYRFNHSIRFLLKMFWLLFKYDVQYLTRLLFLFLNELTKKMRSRLEVGEFEEFKSTTDINLFQEPILIVFVASVLLVFLGYMLSHVCLCSFLYPFYAAISLMLS